MKIWTILLIMLIIQAGCQQAQQDQKADEQALTDSTKILNDTTPRVTGVGGIFFFSDNPDSTRNWYARHLGLKVNQYGSSFEFRNAGNPDEINYLQWSPFRNGHSYFQPSQKDFMINYRVNNLVGLVRNLKKEGVIVLDSIETYDYGKFVHIMDADGNKIELWEPIDSVLTAIGSETTK